MDVSSERVRVAKNGRLVIPAPYRKALGVAGGGELLLTIRDGRLELEPPHLAVERAREAVQRYAAGRDLAGELLRERREDAADE